MPLSIPRVVALTFGKLLRRRFPGSSFGWPPRRQLGGQFVSGSQVDGLVRIPSQGQNSV
jgi:hypothetical protein